MEHVETKASLEEKETNKSRSQADAEDSDGWLDFDDKQNIPLSIKEMEDVDVESEVESERFSAEPVKTWNNIEINEVFVFFLNIVKFNMKGV